MNEIEWKKILKENSALTMKYDRENSTLNKLLETIYEK